MSQLIFFERIREVLVNENPDVVPVHEYYDHDIRDCARLFPTLQIPVGHAKWWS